jgi:exodeoxyribonuclease-5
MKLFSTIEKAYCISAHRAPEKFTVDEVEESFGGVTSADELSDEQREALYKILAWSAHPVPEPEVFSLAGNAGTGKTTLLGVLAAVWSSRRVAYCALTGRATSILRRTLRKAGASPTFVGTIHSLFYRPVQDKMGNLRSFQRVHPDDISREYDLIVVDEASMVDEALADDILEPGLPVLAVGDHGQLPPINGVSVWMNEPDIRLETIHRQAEGSSIISLATHVRTGNRLHDYNFGKESHEVDWIHPGQFNEHLDIAYKKHTPREVAVLVYTNKNRVMLNRYAHYLWTGQAPDSEDPPVKGSWIIGLKNQYEHGLTNGMRGFLDSDAEVQREHWYRPRIYFPNEQLEVTGDCLKYQFDRTATFSDLSEIQQLCRSNDTPKWRQVGLLLDYGYALTVHKAQGGQFKHVFLVVERPYKVTADDFQRWLYTGVTRASTKVTIVAPM